MMPVLLEEANFLTLSHNSWQGLLGHLRQN
jgi:hypothetical protein